MEDGLIPCQIGNHRTLKVDGISIMKTSLLCTCILFYDAPRKTSYVFVDESIACIGHDCNLYLTYDGLEEKNTNICMYFQLYKMTDANIQ